MKKKKITNWSQLMNYYNKTWINEILIIFNYNLKSYFQNDSYILIIVVLSNGQKLFLSFLCLFQDMLKSWVFATNAYRYLHVLFFPFSLSLSFIITFSVFYLRMVGYFYILKQRSCNNWKSTDREKRNGMERFFSFLKRFLWTWKISAFFCIKEFF